MTSHDAVQLERIARERAERRLARIAAIQQVIDDAGSKPELEPLLQALVEELREALSSDTATILLTDETGTELLRRTSSGVEGGSPSQRGFRWAEALRDGWPPARRR